MRAFSKIWAIEKMKKIERKTTTSRLRRKFRLIRGKQQGLQWFLGLYSSRPFVMIEF